jgi:hypothetical protein
VCCAKGRVVALVLAAVLHCVDIGWPEPHLLTLDRTTMISPNHCNNAAALVKSITGIQASASRELNYCRVLHAFLLNAPHVD